MHYSNKKLPNIRVGNVAIVSIISTFKHYLYQQVRFLG